MARIRANFSLKIASNSASFRALDAKTSAFLAPKRAKMGATSHSGAALSVADADAGKSRAFPGLALDRSACFL